MTGGATIQRLSPCDNHRCPSCQELFSEANITQHVNCQIMCPHCGEWVKVPAEWEAEIELSKKYNRKT